MKSNSPSFGDLMIKLLIADDEPFIRKGIRTAIAWQEHNIEVVGEASNGREALQLALQLEPDIILADIQMPVLTGLELAKQVHVLLPQTKIIILSAYGSTENLTSAIETKVSRFVLKNASCSDILDNVLAVCKEIELSRQALNDYTHLHTIYNENQQLIKSTMVIRYLTNQMSLSDFQAKIQKEQFDLTGPYYAILAVKCPSSDDWQSINAFKVAFAKYRPFALFMEDSKLVMLLNTDKDGISEYTIDQLLPEIKPYFSSNQLVLINGLETIGEFPIAYTTINNCLDYCFWNTEQDYTIITPAYTLRKTEDDKFPGQEKEIISALLSGNNKAIEDALGQYYDFCRNAPVSKSVFLDSVRRLILLISSIRSEDIDTDSAISYLYELETPDEIMQYLESLIIPNLPFKAQMPRIVDALSYINLHYDEDIMLHDVAQAISLSDGYLSRVFKAETGYSFKEYIHRVRIDKAKELIAATNMKYYEIAEKVGYKEYKYFATYFNKLCGCSAKEYRNKCIKDAMPD